MNMKKRAERLFFIRDKGLRRGKTAFYRGAFGAVLRLCRLCVAERHP